MDAVLGGLVGYVLAALVDSAPAQIPMWMALVAVGFALMLPTIRGRLARIRVARHNRISDQKQTNELLKEIRDELTGRPPAGGRSIDRSPELISGQRAAEPPMSQTVSPTQPK